MLGMKLKSVVVPVVLLSALVAPAMADPSWQLVPFNYVYAGGLSYDPTGGNVVTDTSMFKTSMSAGHVPLSTQKIGGDGVDNPVTGNFAFWGTFAYTDNYGVLGWAAAHPNTPLALEIGAHPLNFIDPVSEFEFSNYFALDARPTTNYLKASYAELGAWGCTEIGNGIWMDIVVAPNSPTTGTVAISIVMQDFDLGPTALEVKVKSGPLDGEIGNWRASGMRIAPIPAPGAAALGFLGLGIIGWFKRRVA